MWMKASLKSIEKQIIKFRYTKVYGLLGYEQKKQIALILEIVGFSVPRKLWFQTCFPYEDRKMYTKSTIVFLGPGLCGTCLLPTA